MTNQVAVKPLLKASDNNITYEQKNLKYSIAAWLYFPLQYLIFRFLIIGTEMAPSLDAMYKGFNVAGVIGVITDFISHFGTVFEAEHVAFIVVNIMPYIIRLAFNLIPIAVFIYAFYTFFVVFIIAQVSIFTHNASVNLTNIVTVRSGPPGTGKSSSAGYDVKIMADMMYSELRWKYWEMRYKIAEYIEAGNVQKILEWYEVRDSYEYYITHDCIPCMWSNIPIRVNGQFSSIITYQHAAQIERVPYYSVIYFDESGSVFRVDAWHDKPLTVSDFFRLARHLGEFRIVCTEQDASNVFKDVRRVTSQNWLMIEQKWVNKPLLLLIPYKILKAYFLWSDKGNKTLADFMLSYKKLLNHIGQRRYKYIAKQSDINTLTHGEGKREKTKMFYLPTMLNYQYSDRTFKNLYLAKGKEIPDGQIFEELEIQNTKQNRERYLKATDPTAKQKEPDEEEAA